MHAHCIPVGVVDELVRDGGRYGIEIAEAEGGRRATIAGAERTAVFRADLGTWSGACGC